MKIIMCEFCRSLTIIIWLLALNYFFEGKTSPVFRFSSWDFATILKTTAFIDKTFLIKTLFEEGEIVLIIAPRLSGKSTNLNMVQRFLELSEHSYRKESDQPVNNTANLKLFKRNNLNIFSYHHLFFLKHFGTYPVIFIDYKPLSKINSFINTLEQFREILMNTFEKHEYLLDNPKLWLTMRGKDLFAKYCQSGIYISLTEEEISGAFLFLSKILFRHFNKKVYVLVDDFDAFVESPNLKESPDKDKIIYFLRTINTNLFEGNKFLFRALICGVVRPNSTRLFVSSDEILPNNVVKFHTEKYNCFSKYYGVTAEELDNLLTKCFTKDAHRQKLKSKIIVKSSVVEQKTQVYSLWSVLRYLANFNETVNAK